MQQARTQMTGIGLALFAVLVLSPDAALIRLVEADRATLLFWRGFLEGITLMVAVTIIYRGRVIASILRMGRWGPIAIVLFTLSQIGFVMSITLTTAANTLFMLATAPLFAALMSRIFLGEPIALRTWIAIAAALCGIGIIFSGSLGGGNLLGDLLGLGTAMTMAAQFSIARHARHVSLVPALALAMLLVALLVGPTFASPLEVGERDWIWLSLMGFIVVPVAFGLLTLAPRYIPSPEVTLIMQLEVVLGPLFVWMVVAEVPGVATFIGGGIVLVTLVTHSLLGIRAYRRRTRRPRPPHTITPR